MPEARERLLQIAAEVADGTCVPWTSVESSASDDERRLIEELRVLERIAEVHTQAPWTATPRPETHSAGEVSQITGVVSEDDCWGSLRIVERIGGGAFGDVYRAWDPRLDREVALKLLRPRAALGSAVETLPESSVIEEGRLMARVRHPSVVTVHGAEQIGGRVGVWMELIDGRTLAQEVAERGPLPPREVQQIGAHLADALAAVHHAGVLHRDIKAQNVMREPSGRPVLMDFGTGLDLGDDAGALAGTPLYLAPELIGGGQASTRSDVYSLGVLLFHLATGAFPVRGNTLRSIQRAHARHEAHRIRDVNRAVPRSLAGVIQRAIATQASDRFATAEAMSAALRAVAPEVRRRRYMALAGATVVCVAAAVTFAAFRLPSSPRGTPVHSGGIIEQQIDPDLQKRVAIRGPAAGNWIPCHPRGSNGAIAVCDLSNGSVRVLRPAPAPAGPYPSGRQALSPDGRRLAYHWAAGPREARHQSVRAISIDGTDDRELYRTTKVVDIQKWTSDSTSVVLREGMTQADGRALLVHDVTSDVQDLASLDASVRTTDLSPDGRTLLVTRSAGEQHDISVIDLATGAEVWSLTEPTDDSHALYTPDGRGVVFVSDRSGCEGIMFLSLHDGLPAGAPIPLKDLGRNHAIPMGFAADASYLVTLQQASRTSFRSLLDLDRGIVQAGRPLSFRCTEDTNSADWDPGGERIAFLSGRFRGTSRARVIVQSRDGRIAGEWPAPGVLSRGSRVRWSPDGRLLAVVSGTAKMLGRVHLLDPSTGETRQVITGVGMEGVDDIRWAARDHWLYYRTGETIRRVKPGGSQPETVFTVPEGHAFGVGSGFDVSPRDQELVVTTATRDFEQCWVRIVDAQGTDQVRHRFPGECQAVVWTRDGDRLLVGTFPVSRSEFWLLARAGGDPVKLSLDAEGIWDLSLSPDGRELLYSTGNPRPNMVVLRGLSGAR